MKRKRQFELVSAIIGLILGALIALSGVIALIIPADVLRELNPEAFAGMTYDEIALNSTVRGIIALV